MRRDGTFQATGDDGQSYTVDIFVEEVASPTAEEPDRVRDGGTVLRLANGRLVYRIDGGRYRTIGPRPMDLTSDDPAAPSA
jgi:hypothetical protein